MKALPCTLLGMMLHLLTLTHLQSQVIVGFSSSPSPGPYTGNLSDPNTGTVDVGSPSGRIEFGLSSTPGTWTKGLQFNTGDLNPGGVITIAEYLRWDGTGPSPFTDWHETIQTPNFQWKTGSTISIGPTAGSLSSSTQLDFNFPAQSSAVDFTITKSLEYTGGSVLSAPFSIVIQEQPSVPEPEQGVLVCGFVVLLWAVSGRLRAVCRGLESKA